MSPLRPWVSVVTIHEQNTSGWHPATSGVERAIRQLIVGILYRIGASWPSEPMRCGVQAPPLLRKGGAWTPQGGIGVDSGLGGVS